MSASTQGQPEGQAGEQNGQPAEVSEQGAPGAGAGERVIRKRKVVRHVKRRPRWGRRIVALCVVLLLIGGGLVYFLRTRSKPYRTKQYLNEAQLLLKVGKAEEALEPLSKARELMPDHPQINERLALVYVALGRFEEAEKTLREGLEKRPNARELLIQLTRLLLDQGRGDHAWQVIGDKLEVLRRIPDDKERAQALILAGRAAAEAGEYEQAKTLLREAAFGSKKSEALTALGRVLASNQEWKEAEKVLREALEAAPGEVNATLVLARVLEATERRDEAIGLLRKTYKAGGEQALTVATQLGDLLIRSGRLDEARALAEELAKETRGLVASAYISGAIAMAEGDYAAAESNFERMAQLLKKAARPYVLLARARLRRGDVDGARAAYEKALELRPGLVEAELGLLDLDERASRVVAIRERAERLLKRPDTRPRAIRALMGTYSRGPEVLAGLEHLRKLREEYPNDRLIMVNEAIFKVLAGKTEEGINALLKLAEQDPDLPGAFSLLASAQEQTADALEAIETLARLAEKDERFARARLVLADIYERLGRHDLALQQAEAALKARPNLPEARLLMARLAANGGDTERAIKELEHLRKLRPNDGQVLLSLAQFKAATGDIEGAITLLEQLRRRAPGNPGVLARLARAYALSHRDQDALETYAALQRLRPRDASSHEDAILLFERGDMKRALLALQRALDKTEDPRFALVLGIAKVLQGDVRRGIELFNRWRARVKASPEAVIAHAMLLALAGQPRRAQLVADTVRLAPEVRAEAAGLPALRKGGVLDPRVRTALEIFTLLAVGWRQEAAQRAEALARDPRAGALATWWAMRALQGRGVKVNPEAQRTLAERLAALAPTDVGPGLNLASVYLAQDDTQAELATLRELEERFPENKVVALRLGMALERLGDVPGAIEQYMRAIATENPSPVALNNLAYLLSSDPARRAEAVGYARRAARAAPKLGEIQDTYGWLLFLNERYEEAAPALARAAVAAPSNPTVRYHLARVLDARGEPERARNHLEMALMSTTPFREREEAKALYDRIGAELEAVRAAAEGKTGTLAIGEERSIKTDANGLAALKIPGVDGAVAEAELRIEAPKGVALDMTLTGAKGTYKRSHIPAGQELVLRRLAIQPAGHVLVVRVAAPPGSVLEGKEVRVRLREVRPLDGGVTLELEPNDERDAANTLNVGARIAGWIDGMVDRDFVRLGVSEKTLSTLVITAGERGPLRVDFVVGLGTSARIARVIRIKAGDRITIDSLALPQSGPLAVRLGPADRMKVTGPIGDGAPDWRLALGAGMDAKATYDREPNDQVEDAVAVVPDADPIRGVLSVIDRADAYRVKVEPGTVLTFRLRDTTGGRIDAASRRLGLELWERSGVRIQPMRRYELADEVLTVSRWRAPREGELIASVVAADGVSGTAEVTYELKVERAKAPSADVETEPNDRPALADVVSAGRPVEASLDVAGDRDWFRVPKELQGRLIRLSLQAPPTFSGALVTVFLDADRDPRFVASFDPAGGALEVPALRLSDGVAAVAVATLSTPPGAYRLTIAPAEVDGSTEIEPNDNLSQAIDLVVGRVIKGRISGRRDRDLYRVEADKGLALKSTGKAPISVVVTWEESEDRLQRTLEPGKTLRFSAEELGGGGEALVQLAPVLPEGEEGEAVSRSQARLGASYEIRSVQR